MSASSRPDTSVASQAGLPTRAVPLPALSLDTDAPTASLQGSKDKPPRPGRMRVSSFGFGVRRESQLPTPAKEDETTSTKPGKVKGRLRAGTWKGSSSSSRSSTSPRRDMPFFDSDSSTGVSATALPPSASTSAMSSESRAGSNTRPPAAVSSPITPHSAERNPVPAASGFNRRKLFGRNNSIRNLLGVGVGGGGNHNSNNNDGPASAGVIAGAAEPGSSSSGSNSAMLSPTSSPSTTSQKDHSLSLLRRMGSRSFLNINQSAHPNSSTDNLSTKSTESHSSSNRLSDSFKLLSRNRGRSNSRSNDSQRTPVSEFGHHASRQVHSDSIPTNASRRSGESARSSFSATSIDRRHRSSDIDHGSGASVAQNASSGSAMDTHDAASNASGATVNIGIPKRLSGWLYNMVGSDNSPGYMEGSSLSPVKEADVPERAFNFSPSRKKSDLSTRRSLRESSPPTLVEAVHVRPPDAPATPGIAAATPVRSKAGALLQTFAVAPNKTHKAAPSASGSGVGASSTPGNAAGSWMPSGVGLDRAFKFFLDTDADGRNDEGIWLLGVWHGPSQSVSLSKQLATLPDEAKPLAVLEGRIDANCRDESETDVKETSQTPTSVRASLTASSPTQQHSGLHPESGQSQNHADIAGGAGGRDASAQARELESAGDGHVGSSVTTADTETTPASTADSIRSVSSVTSAQATSQSVVSTASAITAASDWQATFQPDFSSRIWCTYRNHFAPIARDGTITSDAAAAAEQLSLQNAAASHASSQAAASPIEGTTPGSPPTSAGRNWLGRKFTESSAAQHDPPPSASPVSPIGLGAALGASYTQASSSLGEKMGITNLWGRATAAAQAAGFSRSGLTTDAGWGCMLRTGQSLLANALIDVHLGRSWLREPSPPKQAQLLERLSQSCNDHVAEKEALLAWRQRRSRHATYVRILSWFLDDPSPACPFGVHRMAREGKRLGKEVGEWFGPSTAAGAIKQLVSEFPEAGIGVELAHDGVFYLDEVRAAAVHRSAGSASRRRASTVWQRPVLILIGIRLGLDSVNPIYYDSVKATFSFPQSVGIAGGRPSSSYYFMGHQGNSLFYLDPHNVRPAVQLRFPPKPYPAAVPEHLDVAYRYERNDRDDEDEWWAHAYSDAQTSTFHCDKVRRMPIKSLDPSMLLGFLIKDEASLQDFCARIKALPKTILSFADSAPRWVDDDDFDPSMESFSESSVGGDFDRDEDGDENENGHRKPEGGGRRDGDRQQSPEAAPDSSKNAETASTPLVADTRAVAARASAMTRGINVQSKQRTMDWVGRGRPTPASSSPSPAAPSGGIAFPSLDLLATPDTDSQQAPRRLSRHDVRQASTSSASTTRPAGGRRPDDTERNLTASYSGSTVAGFALSPAGAVGERLSPSASPNRAAVGGGLGDDSFSTMHLSDSEAGSAWEEVSEVGTIPASTSHAGQMTSSSGAATSRPATAGARYQSQFDPVLVEQPEIVSPISPGSDMVAINLDTPTEEPVVVTAPDADDELISVASVSVPVDLATPRGGGIIIAGGDGAAGLGRQSSPDRRSAAADGTGDYFGLTTAHAPMHLPRRRSQSRVSIADLPPPQPESVPPIPPIPSVYAVPLAGSSADIESKSEAAAPGMDQPQRSSAQTGSVSPPDLKRSPRLDDDDDDF